MYIGTSVGILFLIGFGVALRFFAVPPLSITQSIPITGTTLNPFSPVVIYFNRPPKNGEVTFDIQPKTDVSIKISSESSIFIYPKTMFAPSSTYQITANTSPPFSLRFETEQAENNTPGWNDMFNAAQQKYEQEHGAQDKALTAIRTKTPIKEVGFQIDYSYKNNTFTVSLFAPYESNRAAFLSWIKQKGVLDLSTVRIVYVNK